jgi:hypothetical protein
MTHSTRSKNGEKREDDVLSSDKEWRVMSRGHGPAQPVIVEIDDEQDQNDQGFR